MKKLSIVFLAFTLLISATVGVSAVSLSTGLDIIAEEYDVTVSALKGEDVTFSRNDFTEASGNKSFSEIKIEKLPDSAEGTLYFGDVAAVEGQVIKAESLESLVFDPEDSAEKTSFDFIFDDSYAMTCNIMFSEKQNSAPTVVSDNEAVVFTSEKTCGEMRSFDADGDEVFYEVIDYPKGGEMTFDSKTGEFTYTAGSRVMNDSFTFKVKDSKGEYSQTAVFTLKVTDNESETVFLDMKENPSVTAATVMTDKGFMTCNESGGKLSFEPDGEMTRLEFLVSAMNVFRAGRIPEIEDCGFADDSEVPEEYKGYVYSAAKLGIINGVDGESGRCFCPNEYITRAEAAVILNNIIGYTATTVGSFEEVPQWAGEAVSAMYELGVYGLDGGKALSEETLCRSEASEMFYKIDRLLGE